MADMRPTASLYDELSDVAASNGIDVTDDGLLAVVVRGLRDELLDSYDSNNRRAVYAVGLTVSGIVALRDDWWRYEGPRDQLAIIVMEDVIIALLAVFDSGPATTVLYRLSEILETTGEWFGPAHYFELAGLLLGTMTSMVNDARSIDCLSDGTNDGLEEVLEDFRDVGFATDDTLEHIGDDYFDVIVMEHCEDVINRAEDRGTIEKLVFDLANMSSL